MPTGIIATFPEAGVQILNGRYGPYVSDRQEECEDPQGSRTENIDARGLSQADRGCAGALRSLWQGKGTKGAAPKAETPAAPALVAKTPKPRARKSAPDLKTRAGRQEKGACEKKLVNA